MGKSGGGGWFFVDGFDCFYGFFLYYFCKIYDYYIFF